MSEQIPAHLANMSNFTTETGFNFSATDIPSLKQAAYCVVNIVVDNSGSIHKYKQQIEEMLKQVYAAISDPKYPHKDDILLRVLLLGAGHDGRQVEEIHGYKMLDEIDPSIYTGKVDARGVTPLLDAIVNAAESAANYSDTLDEEQFLTNCITFIITDGYEYGSQKVKNNRQAKAAILSSIDSSLESINQILIGVVDVNDQTNTSLERLKEDLGLDAYESINNLTDTTSVQALSGFITSNITSSSSAVGSGNKSAVVGSLQID